MSRLRRIEITGRFFFVTTNLAVKVFPLSPSERDTCLSLLGETRAKHNFKLFAYVIMPTHVHFLCRLMEGSLPALMRDWKGKSGFAIAKARKVQGAIWQARYYDFILRRVADFWDKFDYIHQNPVNAKLVKSPEDWRWSSFDFFARKRPVLVSPDPFELPADHNFPLLQRSWD